MKIELEPKDIEAISQRVLELLKPYLAPREKLEEIRGLPKNPRVYLNSEQVAEYLQVSVATIRAWTYQRKIPFADWGVRELIWSGKLPCVRAKKKIYLDIRDLDEFIENHKMRYDF